MGAKPKTQDVQQTHKTAPKPVQPTAEAAEFQVEQEPFELLLQRARLEPDSISPKDSSRIQRTIGNQAYQQLNNASIHQQPSPQATQASLQAILGRTAVLTNGTSKRKTAVQPKLEVNEVNDPFEQEADAVAEQVMKMPVAAPPPPTDNNTPPDDDDKPPTVQRQADTLGGTDVEPEVENRVTDLKGKGSPLPEQERSFFEDRMGADFSGVRIHSDSNAAQLSQDLNARAFTVGSDIAFNEGEYQPGSNDGRKLLAHELTHTIQQGATNKTVAPKAKVQRQEGTEAGEAEEEGPTEEEKAAALAAAAAAEAAAEAARQTEQSQAETSRAQAATEQEAAAAPQEEVNAALAEGPIQDNPPENATSGEAGPGPQAETEPGGSPASGGQAATPESNGAGPSPGGQAATPAPNGQAAAEGGGDLSMATATAQAAVEESFASSEAAQAETPASAQEDPRYQQVVETTGSASEDQKTHEPAATEASQAQDAVVVPQAEVESRAEGNQVQDMESAETPGFDAAGFKAALMARIAELAPSTAEEADNFKDNNALGGVKTDMQGQVTQEQAATETPLEEATTQAPDPATVEVREATPLEAEEPVQAPTDVGAEEATPEPRTTEQVETPIAESSQSLDQQMADADITEEQLAKSNEPEFTAALDAKNEAQTDAAEAPQTYRQDESSMLETAQSEAVTTATTAMGDMQTARVDGLTAVSSQQTETMSQDEQRRAEVAADITAIYERTKTNVEAILSRLDGEVEQIFDAGAQEAQQAFENFVEAKMEAYKEERYGGFWGWAKWAKDKLLGMPGEVNAFYNEGRQLYLDKMDAVIDNVIALIGRTLAEAKAEVASGKQEIQNYVDQLPEDLQTVGQEAADAIQGRFDELEGQIDSKQDELINTLAQKYNENLQAIDARIEEMKAANRGLVDKAIDAVGGVIQTILELKNLLMEVLSSVADAVMKILKDPIGFISNLISAIGQGLQNFVSNIATHLQTGFIEWLTGTLSGGGIQLPENIFSLEGIFDLVLQILGLTWNNIRTRAVNLLGEPIVNALETGFELFMIIKEEGLAGLWEYVQEHINTLKETVIDGIKEMLITEVIEAGVQWLIGLLGGPAGAFIKAAKMIYDIVMWFVNNASRIASLVKGITQAVGAIAAGNLAGAAKYVEESLANFIPVAIGFLASLLGIGDLAAKVRKIIDKVQEPINAAIDWLLDKAKKVAKRIGRALGFDVGDEQEGDEAGDGKTGDGEVGKTVNFAADGDSHRLWYNVEGESATLMVASETMTVEAKVLQWERSLNEDGDMLGEKEPQARTLLASAKSMLGIAEQEGDEAAKEKREADQDQENDQKEAEFEQADQQAEQAQETLSGVLRQLFEIFGETPPELTGDAKTKMDQVMADRHIPNALRNQYSDAVYKELVEAGAGADQYGILKSVAAQGDYFAKGPEIPVSEIDAKGGMARVIPLQTIWNDNLDPAYKDQFGTFESWLEALGEDSSQFNPDAHMNPGSTVPGQYATAWWAPRSQQQGNTMAELIEELALNPASYEGGCVRVTVSAAASQTAGFKKPTALDGIFFMEFSPAPANVWGVTGGGSLEAVAPKISVSEVTQKEFLPANLPEGSSIESKIEENEQPFLNEEGAITKENAEQVATTTTQESGDIQITVEDGGETWDYKIQRMGTRKAQNRYKATKRSDGLIEGDFKNFVWDGYPAHNVTPHPVNAEFGHANGTTVPKPTGKYIVPMGRGYMGAPSTDEWRIIIDDEKNEIKDEGKTENQAKRELEQKYGLVWTDLYLLGWEAHHIHPRDWNGGDEASNLQYLKQNPKGAAGEVSGQQHSPFTNWWNNTRKPDILEEVS